MPKKFKLVYEDEGMLKGSYSGIPCKDDTNVIERAVLEGIKPVPPAPEPEPQPIEVTINQVEEMFRALYVYDEETEIATIGEYIFDYNQDYICKCSGLALKDIFESTEIESFQLLINDLDETENGPWFSVNDDLIERTGENSMGGTTLVSYPEEYRDFCEIDIEIDAETGDSRIVWYNFPDAQIEFKFNRKK